MSDKAISDFARRLAELAATNGGKAKLARILGWHPTTLSAYLHGRREPGMEVLRTIARKAKCSIAWLVDGKGTMFESPTISPTVNVVQTQGKHIGDVAGDLIAIPILRDASAAGPGRVIRDDDVEGIGVIYRGWCPHPEKTDYVRVSGDSMLPTLPDGCLVTIDKSEVEPQSLKGQVVAVWLADRDEVTIKRLRYDAGRKVWKAIPDNITETNLPFDLTGKDRVIGKVRSVHAEVK